MKNNAIILFTITALFSACQVLNPTLAATPVPPTPTPLPPKEITVCLGSEPESLYRYSANSAAAQSVMQALYDGPFDVANGEPTAVILEKVPNLADGSAFFTPTAVQAGDTVVNTAGYLVPLQAGVQVFPSGCTTADCAITWDGTAPIQMDQLTAVYKLKPGLTWSDGQPLKASDSVYSFKMDADPATPTGKRQVDLTASYSAPDDLTVQWVSQPGLAVDDFAPFFWAPLPEHAWGKYAPGGLLAADEVIHTPLGWGPYVIDAWTKGEGLRLVKNPYYFRAGEGLPYFEILNFKFLDLSGAPADMQQISGTCDIVSDTALDIASLASLKGALAGSGYKMTAYESGRLEMLAFGITPASYDENYYPYGGDRPDIFGDVRTRQAIAACINRQALVDGLAGGLAGVANAFLPAADAMAAGAALNQNAYDPAAAQALLQAAGWLDLDQNPETPLAHAGSARLAYGTPLEFTLLSTTAALQVELANRIAADLKACGIKANVLSVPANELYKSAPDGSVFGRNFDAVLLPWQTGLEFNCAYFEAKEIPSAANNWLGDLTGGANFYGFANPTFDAECERLKTSGLDNTAREQAGSGLLQVLSNDLPFIPLFHFPEGNLMRENLCVPGGSPTEASLFASIESLNDLGGC